MNENLSIRVCKAYIRIDSLHLLVYYINVTPFLLFRILTELVGVCQKHILDLSNYLKDF